MALHGRLHQLTDHRKTQCLIIAFNLILCLFIVWNPFGIGLICKFILSKWVYSTSNGAQLSFLIFLSAIVLCFSNKNSFLNTTILKNNNSVTNSFIKHYQKKHEISKYLKFKISFKKVFYCSSLMGFAITFYLNLNYYYTLSVPLHAHVFHFQDEQFTFNSFLHNHHGKLIFSYINNFFEKKIFDQYDLALPLIRYVDVSWIILFGILWISSIYSAFCLTLSQAKGKSSLVFTFSLALAYFIILKNMIDGGILNYNTIPAYLFLTCVNIKRFKKTAYVFFSFFYSVLYFMIFHQVYFFSNMMFIEIYFFLAILMESKGFIKKSKLICFTILSILIVFDLYFNLKPLFKKIVSSQQLLYYCDGACRIIPYPQYQGLRMWQVSEKYEKNPFKWHHLVYIEKQSNCSFDSFNLIFKPVKFKQVQGSLNSNSLFSIFNLKRLNHDWLQIRLRVKFPFDHMFCLNSSENILYRNNYFVFLWQVNSFFQKGGIEEYIVLEY